MKQKLFEPQSGILSVPYEPNEHTVLMENPPRFTWMPAQLENDRYVLQISSSPDFVESDTEQIEPIPYNFYTPDHAYSPGTYYWRYALLNEVDESEADKSAGQHKLASGRIHSEWSKIRSFVIPPELPLTPLPAAEHRFSETTAEHPRLWLQSAQIEQFRANLKQDADYCGWDIFYEKSVLPWLNREPIQEPARYPNNKRVAHLWRKMYIDCQEALYAIRHLSVAGVILQNDEIIAHAKKWLMAVASWDVDGSTSRDYNDEASFRIIGALAWGYDWLYNELAEDERIVVRLSLLARTEQVAFHVMERSKIHQVPFDSHAVRSLSSALVPAGIALLHEEPRAKVWLDYTLEYYACLYSPWGGEDGGWAEGPMYWTTGMAYVIDALNMLKSYCGINMFKRPFFSRTGDFPLYCFSPGTTRASFCDQSTLGEPPSLKTAFNIRHFAGVTGNGLYQWYYEQVKDQDVDPDSKFYNYGWWDFRFDNMLYQHDYPQVEAVVPTEQNIESVKWFRDIGWVAMHHKMDDPKEHIMFLIKSSKYGSISHSHGDQNGFLLHAFGEPLAIESGYYIAFGSTMHRNWRRQTKSTNNILIEGEGQYAGTNKVLSMEASGTIEEVRSTADYSYSRSNATAAYRETVPHLERYVREVYFFNGSYIVIVDYVDLSKPASMEWLLHTLHPMELSDQSFRVQGEKADMDVRFVYSSSGGLTLTQHDEFTGVDPAEIEGLANQWHLHASTKSAHAHRLVTLLVPKKKGDSRYVSYFMDDQDHGVHLYFTNETGKTQKVEVQKAY